MIAITDRMNSEQANVVSTRSYSARDRMTLLPENFEPSEDDVICGRGKKCYGHIGNSKFRDRVIGMLDAYRKARSKLDKSKVLSDVVEQVRLNSPRGGFVKQDSQGRWHEVGDFLAREKTSQAFRDALHENYKSSNVSKKKRRQQEAPRGEKSKKMSSEGDIERGMEKLSFGFEKTQRRSVELRQDFDRAHSFSPTRSSSFRLGSTNREAVTELDMAKLGGVNNSFKPFRFCERETTRLGSHSEVRSRSRRGYRPTQSYSVPSSPSNVPLSYDNAPSELFHSVPNMHFSFDPQSEPTIDEMESMHHSAPDLYFDPNDRDIEPLPYGTSALDLSSRGSIEEHTDRDDSVTISSSLIESLARLTSMEKDDNPFEPIPLSPASKRRPSVSMTGNDFLNIEERSLPDAFEEE